MIKINFFNEFRLMANMKSRVKMKWIIASQCSSIWVPCRWFVCKLWVWALAWGKGYAEWGDLFVCKLTKSKLLKLDMRKEFLIGTGRVQSNLTLEIRRERHCHYELETFCMNWKLMRSIVDESSASSNNTAIHESFRLIYLLKREKNWDNFEST